MNSNKAVKNEIVKRAFKGALLHQYYELKKTLTVGMLITFFSFVLQVILMIISTKFKLDSNSNGGVLTTGFMVMLICMFIYALSSTSKNDRVSRFSFPLNRSIFAITNFISYIIASFVFLAAITILAPLEIIAYKTLETFSSSFYFVNTMTINSYFVGLFSAWGYMLALGSVTYCIFTFVREYVVQTLSVLGIFVFFIIGQGWILDIGKFIFFEDSLIMLIIKLLIISIVSHILAYIPLKRMEVVK